MFEELVEQIRLEYRSGRYGHYDVDRPKSHIAKLLGGISKVAKGGMGIGTLGTMSFGDHPGTADDAERKAESDRKKAEAARKKVEPVESIEGINGVLIELRVALAEGRTKAQQYHGMMAQHPDKGIRKAAGTQAGKESAAGLVSKAKDRRNQLAPQLIKAFRQDNRMGKAVRK